MIEFEKPKIETELLSTDGKHGKFVVEPLERGFGNTLGNSLRRVLLSSLEGVAVKSIKIEGVLHEFSTIPGVKEDVTQIILNMKGLTAKLNCQVHEPKLLIFDEPFSGFDPINANLLKQEILGLRDRGATVIFSTHNMESVEEICDDITLINKSNNILSGSVDEIRRKAGGNTFQVLYSGTHEDFCAAVTGKANLIGQSEGVIGGYTQQKIHIPSDDNVRAVIGSLNDKVQLRSFQEIIPSMNDIFIRAVNGTL